MASDIATDETVDLIASDRVEGTAVYNRAGERLGKVENFMVDKVSGTARYAVLSFGGFLGMGKEHYPLPWNLLTYDSDQDGYVVDLDKSTLEGAPRYDGQSEPRFDSDYGRGIYSYYGVSYPW
ncbi:PRC-barrel domain-containing protein [Rhizorhapis sp. SPR117]|uniref:PRC-barrel domain-containing protein n=1 Tax=Rhizorhapis sp. SPR117 TaxID=2912611 RepID=UPI001F15E5BB|nr:PRC-barrel domain-containing protein [Rhizorhapis sp. SPR117]